MTNKKVIDFKAARQKAEMSMLEETTFIIRGDGAMAETVQDQITVKTAQLEDGYAKVANGLLEEYCSTPSIPAYMRLHWLVIRLTYGFNRKEAVIKLAEVAEACNIPSNHVVRYFKKLASTHLIHSLKKKERGCYEVWLNKNAEEFVKPMRNKDLDKFEIEEEKTPVIPQTGDESLSPDQGQIPPQSGSNLPCSGDYTFIKNKLKTKNSIQNPPGEIPQSGGNGEAGGQGSTNNSFLFSNPQPIPQNLELTEGMRGYAVNKGMDDVDIDFEFEKFVQYNVGKGDRRRDWVAVWRYWCMRWAEMKRQEHDDDEAQIERVMRMVEEDELAKEA